VSNKNLTVHFSESTNGGTDEWETPADLFAELDRVFRFTVDCAASAATAKCKRYFTKEYDAMTKSLERGDVGFLNPPYSLLRAFGEWAHKQKEVGATVVCLIPARTDTRAWHSFYAKGETRFIEGRLGFTLTEAELARVNAARKQLGKKPMKAMTTAPFPSALVVFRPRLRDLNL